MILTTLLYAFLSGMAGGYLALLVFEWTQALAIRRRIKHQSRRQYRDIQHPARLTDAEWARLMGCEIDGQGRLRVVHTRHASQFDGQGSVDE